MYFNIIIKKIPRNVTLFFAPKENRIRVVTFLFHLLDFRAI